MKITAPNSAVPVPVPLAPAGGAASPAQSETHRLADFHVLSGGPMRPARPTRLAERLARQAPSRRRTGPAPAGTSLDDAADDLLNALDGGAMGGVLEDYDLLERHTLLSRARERLDETEENAPARAQIDRALADLEREHGAAIAAGRHGEQAFATALDSLEPFVAPAADAQTGASGMQELRERYGARRNGPTTPAGLFSALIEQAGAQHLEAAMAALRPVLGASLRERNIRGPRLWLALADAASFNVVQTCVGLAQSLRVALSEKAGVLATMDERALTELLLNGNRLGKAPLDQLVDQLSGLAAEAHGPRAQVGLALKNVIARLPDAVWEGQTDRRVALQDQLTSFITQCHSQLPSVRADEQYEQQLRARLPAAGGGA